MDTHESQCRCRRSSNRAVPTLCNRSRQEHCQAIKSQSSEVKVALIERETADEVVRVMAPRKRQGVGKKKKKKDKVHLSDMWERRSSSPASQEMWMSKETEDQFCSLPLFIADGAKLGAVRELVARHSTPKTVGVLFRRKIHA